jgi:hypothetical protein
VAAYKTEPPIQSEMLCQILEMPVSALNVEGLQFSSKTFACESLFPEN